MNTFNEVIIFCSQSLYALDYTYVVCEFKGLFFMQRKLQFIVKKFDNVINNNNNNNNINNNKLDLYSAFLSLKALHRENIQQINK